MNRGSGRAVLLVTSREGYANLCRIISDRNCHGDFHLVKAIREGREGLIVLSDDFGLLKALKSHDFGGVEVEENFLRTYKPIPNRLRGRAS